MEKTFPSVICEGGSSLDVAQGEALILSLCRAYEEKTHMFSLPLGGIDINGHAPQHLYWPGSPYSLAVSKKQKPEIDLFGKKAIENEKFKGKRILKGSKEHALFLFFAVLTDRRQVSANVYKAHTMFWFRHPELYTEKVLTFSEKKLGDILIRYKVGCPRQSAGYWLACARSLFGEFCGDPVRMVKELGGDVSSLQKMKRVSKTKSGDMLPGYGPKITSLYFLFLAELGFHDLPEDAFPVDVHVQRLFIQSGALALSGDISNARMEKMLRPFISGVARKFSLNKVTISHALWLLGSLGCNGCRSNKAAHLTCPIFTACSGPQDTARYFAQGKWCPSDVPMNKGGVAIFRIPLTNNQSTPSRKDGRKQTSPVEKPQAHLFT
jgi:endonuclease III